MNHRIKRMILLLYFACIVSSQFNAAPPAIICNYQLATSGSPISNYCKGLTSGTTMNIYSSGSLATRNGYLSFVPRASDTSAYLRFGGSCFDARGISDVVVELQVFSATLLKIDFGTSNDCVNKQNSDYSSSFSIPFQSGYQNISFPANFFSNMNLQRLFTIGFGSASPLNAEIRIRRIFFARRQFVTRTRHEMFEWTALGTRIPFRFSSFNAPDMIGRSDKGQDGMLDPYEQEDLFISARQMGGRVIRTYTLRIRTSSDISAGVGTSKAIQGIGVWGQTQLLALDRTLQYANIHGIRVIIPLIDNWEYFGGVAAFAALRGKARDTFFTDPTLINDFKNIISGLLNRRNTLTGVLYRNDPAILAWQLGNELCIGELNDGNSPNYRITPPSSWASIMANHIRTLDNNHLIMDGFWSNNANRGGQWDINLVNVRYIDILSAHFYGGESASAPDTEYSSRMSGIALNAFNAGKAAILDEFGIARRAILQNVQNVLKTPENRIAGGFLWSIRSQSVLGGALVHNEYAGFQSYQWPGYTKGPKCNPYFRDDNYDVVTDMLFAAETINQQNGIRAPSIYPPCSHNGRILATSVQPINQQTASCIWSFTHSIMGVSANYRAVNLRIRQPTGSYSNIVQFSFDNVKFVNLNYADMTVTEGNFLYAHKVPVLTTGGTRRNIFYRIAGLLRNFQNTSPSASVSVFVDGVDNAFYNWWNSQSPGVLTNSAAPRC